MKTMYSNINGYNHNNNNNQGNNFVQQNQNRFTGSYFTCGRTEDTEVKNVGIILKILRPAWWYETNQHNSTTIKSPQAMTNGQDNNVTSQNMPSGHGNKTKAMSIDQHITTDPGSNLRRS